MKVTRRRFVGALAAVGLVPSRAPSPEVVDEFVSVATAFSTGSVGRGITALELQQDFSLLVGSGLEENRVLAGMGAAINQYIQDSLAAGQAIPESMGSMIDRLHEVEKK